MKLRLRAMRWLGAIAIGLALVSAGLIFYVQQEPRGKIVGSMDRLKSAPIAIILGASVKQDGTASDALYDRVLTGVELHRQGKASRLLMTGDDGAFHINEIAVMRRLAQEQGVPEQDILADGHGYRTYESCKRAVQVFDIREAIVVTQKFHLSRALFLCSRLGMNVQGVAADRSTYRRIVAFTIRDLAASLKAWWDIYILPPSPPVS